MKKIKLTTGIITVILLIGLIAYFNSNNQDAKLITIDYYQKLADQCEKKTDCCINSVERMKRGNYKLIPDDGCPDGFQGNGLECASSFGWCEPIKQ